MGWAYAVAASLLLMLPPAIAQGAEAPKNAPTWDACAEGTHQDRYLLGRHAKGTAVVEVGSGRNARLAHLWARAAKGGTAIDWPGGRLGLRHLTDPHLMADATPLVKTGRLYLWDTANGWTGALAQITGVELAKSLCDADALVVYLTLKFDDPGEGFVVASAVAPPRDAIAPPDLLPDPPMAVLDRIYDGLLFQLRVGLHSAKLVPASLQLNVFPGHFTGTELEYAVSLRWANSSDDRFSLVYLADAHGELTHLIDRQEGGAGGSIVDIASLDGSGIASLLYQVTTLDGSAAALWSLRDGKLNCLVQTTPVGE
jgi:hypothetical protein